jgi:hypothetical protein
MRKRQTFMLTVLTTAAPHENSTTDKASNVNAISFCGQLKVISTGRACTFTSLEELAELIGAEMNESRSVQAENQGCDLAKDPFPPTAPSNQLA